jgi:16S rRNA (cytosine967-C5)-methyltransferase
MVEGGRLRGLVLELWQRTRMDWGFVTDRLAQTFRRETWIGAHERRFVGETLYGLIRHLRRVDLALARGTRVQRAPRDLDRLFALLVLEGGLEPAQAARRAPDIDWRAVTTVDDVIAAEKRPVQRIALAASLPDWLAARLVAEWGTEAEPLALALNQRAPMTVRANLLVTDRDTLAAELGLATTPGRWSDTALVVDERTNLFATESFKRGALEAQDEGSQLLADLAASLPGSTIVDLCAGAGGKTLAMAARRSNRGRIIAADVDDRKLDELRKRARRATISNARAVHIADGRWPPELDALRGKAEIVLVDAPCSGIGALRRNPEARWRLREADLTTLATKQREIVDSARHLLAPGGRIVYATCTVLRAENQDVVSAIPELQHVPLSEVWPERATALGDGDVLAVTPHRHGTDGFFAQVLTAR